MRAEVSLLDARIAALEKAIGRLDRRLRGRVRRGRMTQAEAFREAVGARNTLVVLTEIRERRERHALYAAIGLEGQRA